MSTGVISADLRAFLRWTGEHSVVLITVTIDQALLDRARSLDVNLSAACERGIAEVTETAIARAELARQVAEYDDNGGVYDAKKLARARQILADADAALAVERIAG